MAGDGRTFAAGLPAGVVLWVVLPLAAGAWRIGTRDA
jgi:hypothetical protein